MTFDRTFNICWWNCLKLFYSTLYFVIILKYAEIFFQGTISRRKCRIEYLINRILWQNKIFGQNFAIFNLHNINLKVFNQINFSKVFCITKSVAFQKVVVKAFLCIPWGKIVKIITFSQYFQFSSINLARTLCKPHIKLIIRLFVTIFLKSIQKGSFLCCRVLNYGPNHFKVHSPTIVSLRLLFL